MDLVEIDGLPRINLSDLKGFFKNCKELRAYAEAKSQEKGFDLEADLDFRQRLIEQNRAAFTFTGSFSKWHTIKIEAEVLSGTMEINSFVFEWDYNGKQGAIRVYLEKRPSNLGLPEPVYYFVCPYTGRISRKLFTDGTTFASRFAFPHTYSSRKDSHNWREFKQIWDGMMYVDGSTKYRKERYRGRLTPHGRKMMRYFGYYLDDMEGRVLRSLNQRGRPRKEAGR